MKNEKIQTIATSSELHTTRQSEAPTRVVSANSASDLTNETSNNAAIQGVRSSREMIKDPVVDVLYQRLGEKWYAFSLVEGETYFSEVSTEQVEEARQRRQPDRGSPNADGSSTHASHQPTFRKVGQS